MSSGFVSKLNIRRNDDIITIPCMVKNEEFNKFLEGFYNNELKDDEEDLGRRHADLVGNIDYCHICLHCNWNFIFNLFLARSSLL